MEKIKKILPSAMYNEDFVDLSKELMQSEQLKYYRTDLF